MSPHIIIIIIIRMHSHSSIHPYLHTYKRIHHIKQRIFPQCVNLIVQLAKRGLVHCDFNEFNLMIDEAGTLTLIDFPQMISTSHSNAKEYFERDVKCIVKFFATKMHYVPEPEEIPSFEEVCYSIGVRKSQSDRYANETMDGSIASPVVPFYMLNVNKHTHSCINKLYICTYRSALPGR